MSSQTLLERACALLSGGAHSLVVVNGGQTRTFDGKGVADLYGLLTAEPSLLKGASVADKVVGKGAAALMIAGGVSEVYAAIISRPALELFRAEGLAPLYGTVVPNIINRRCDGICPVEALCLPCTTAAECIKPISEFFEKL